MKLWMVYNFFMAAISSPLQSAAERRLLTRISEAQLHDIGAGSYPCICFINARRLRHAPRQLRCWLPSNRLHEASSKQQHRVVLVCRGVVSGPWSGCRPASSADGIHCVPRSNRSDPLVIGHSLEPSATYLVCLFPACSACPGGFSMVATCFAFRTAARKRPLFTPVEESPFLVGIEWPRQRFASRPSSSSKALQVLACWSEAACDFHCADDQAEVHTGGYMLPTDLYRFSVYIGLHTARQMMFSAFFDRKMAEPSPPCHVTVRPYGSMAVKLTWRMLGQRLDGFLVSWCRTGGTCASLPLPPNRTSVIIRNLPPLPRFHYFIRSFRGKLNLSNVTYSSPALASWKVHTSFEMVMYLKMLVEFIVAALLAGGAALVLGFILAIRERGHVVAGEGGEADAAAAEAAATQGDHRRHPRRRQPQLQRVSSRGDN